MDWTENASRARKDNMSKITAKQAKYLKQSVPERFWERFKKIILTGPRGPCIRLKCLDCQNYQEAEVRRCTLTFCPLWRFRMGREKSAGDANELE